MDKDSVTPTPPQSGNVIETRFNNVAYFRSFVKIFFSKNKKLFCFFVLNSSIFKYYYIINIFIMLIIIQLLKRIIVTSLK